MQLAVSTYSLARWRSENHKSLEDSLAWIADAGIGAVEFAGVDEKSKDDPIGRARQLREECAKLGLKIAGYCVGAELLVPTEKQREVVRDINRHVDVAAELGAPSMRHVVTRGFGEHAKNLSGTKTFSTAVKHVVPAIREVADYAAAKGVKTSLENHGYYMQQATRVEKLLRAVDHENFGLTIDMGNFLCLNDDPVAAVKRLAKFVIMAHAKDFHVKPKKQMPASGWFATPKNICLRGAIAGHGVIDIPAQLRLLKRAGYDGFISLEFEGMEEPATAVRLGLDYLREQLKAVGA
jgi:sugar phosphate isomerase/epimerase